MVTVLLADDDERFRRTLRSLLEDEDDIRVLGEAKNGREAIEQARSLHPDVVLVDVMMPVCSGIEASREISSTQPWIRVIALSLHNEATFKDAMRVAGARAYVHKDASFAELCAAIRGTRCKDDDPR